MLINTPQGCVLAEPLADLHLQQWLCGHQQLQLHDQICLWHSSGWSDEEYWVGLLEAAG